MGKYGILYRKDLVKAHFYISQFIQFSTNPPF